MLKAGCGQLGAMMEGSIVGINLVGRCLPTWKSLLDAFHLVALEVPSMTDYLLPVLHLGLMPKIRRYHSPGAIFVFQDLNTSGQPANKFVKHSL